MNKLIIILLVLIFIFVLLNSCSIIKRTYKNEINQEISKYSYDDLGVFTVKDVENLPIAVQNYFNYCGYIGNSKMINAKVEWDKFNLKLSPDRNWMKTHALQMNFVPEPARIVYMKTSLFKILNFEGRDKFQNGYGSMQGRLINLIKIFDEENAQMDQSALVTVLSEALLVPSYALQDYISWEEIDNNTVKATIKYNNIEASGNFYFNDEGMFYKFYTEDRFYSSGDINELVPWVIYVDSYQIIDGIKIAEKVRASWILENGEYQYFDGKISNIIFNVKK